MSNNKYTKLEQSRMLKEIGFEAKADGYWVESDDSCLNHISFIKNENINLYYRDEKLIESFSQQYYDEEDKYDVAIPAYRLDTLLLSLPEWCFGYADRHHSTTDIGSRFYDKLPNSDIEESLFDLFTTSGSQAIAAAVDLLVLLKEVEE